MNIDKKKRILWREWIINKDNDGMKRNYGRRKKKKEESLEENEGKKRKNNNTNNRGELYIC